MDTNPVTIELYKRGHDAVEKYDYFVCGVLGAIFAYTAQHYSPQRLGLNVTLLDPISRLILAIAFFFGLKRLSLSSLADNINHRLVDAQDKAEQLSRILDNPKSHKDLSGELVDVEGIRKLHQHYLQQMKDLEKPMALAASKARDYYKYRDRFLILGFAAIFFAKVLQPYGEDAPQRDQQPIQMKSMQSLTAIPSSQTNKPIQKQATPT